MSIGWHKVYGPAVFDVAGDNALFEMGSVYGHGDPLEDGYCRHEGEVVYYVTGSDEDGYGVEVMTHTYTRAGDGELVDQDFDYDYGSVLEYTTLHTAILVATRLATDDESWQLSEWWDAS